MENKIFTGIISDFDYKAMGITKLDGVPVFLNGGIIGDKIEYIVTKEKKNFFEGEILKTLKNSEFRVKSPCPYSKECGGCDFLEYDYQKTLSWKKERVDNNFSKIAGLHVKAQKINESPKRFAYRNNMQFQVRDGKVGLYKKNSRDVVDIKNCIMQSHNANKVLKILRSFKNLKELKTLGIRTNYRNEVMVILSSKERISKLNLLIGNLIDANVVSIYENINKNNKFHYGEEFNLIYGNKYLEDKINDISYNLSPQSFFQINRGQASKLYTRAMDYLGVSSQEKIFDLYCGVGTLSLEIAKRGGNVIGVEIVDSAIEDARKNAEKNKLNARFIRGKSEDILEKLEENEKIKADKVLVDPPRKGLDKNLLKFLCKKEYKKIVYISCNPATLARDLGILKEKYRLEKAEIFDLFPNTAHVESVVLMSRK